MIKIIFINSNFLFTGLSEKLPPTPKDSPIKSATGSTTSPPSVANVSLDFTSATDVRQPAPDSPLNQPMVLSVDDRRRSDLDVSGSPSTIANETTIRQNDSPTLQNFSYADIPSFPQASAGNDMRFANTSHADVDNDDDDFGDFTAGVSTNEIEKDSCNLGSSQCDNLSRVDIENKIIDNIEDNVPGISSSDGLDDSMANNASMCTNFSCTIDKVDETNTISLPTNVEYNDFSEFKGSTVRNIVPSEEKITASIVNVSSYTNVQNKDLLQIKTQMDSTSSQSVSAESCGSLCGERPVQSVDPGLPHDEPFVANKEDDVFHYFHDVTNEGKKVPQPSETKENYSVSEMNDAHTSCALSAAFDHNSSSEKVADFEADASSDFGDFAVPQIEEKAVAELPEIHEDVHKGLEDTSCPSFILPVKNENKTYHLDTESSDNFEAFADFQSFSEIPAATKVSKCDCDAGTEVLADDVVMSCSLPTIEGRTDASPDDDFGYRDIDTEEEEANTATNSPVETRNECVVSTSKEQEEDFDDFVVCTEIPSADHNTVEFDAFASAKIADAFGEFSPDTKDGSANCDSDDGFGDFADHGLENEEMGDLDTDVTFSCKLPASSLSRSVSAESKTELSQISSDPLMKKVRFQLSH